MRSPLHKIRESVDEPRGFYQKQNITGAYFMPHKRTLQGKNKRQIRYVTFEHRTKQQDAIRAIIKDHSSRDPITGEIAYNPAYQKDIENALLNASYCLEITPVFTSKPIKTTIEKTWRDIEPEVAQEALTRLQEGEVLNRPPRTQIIYA